MKNCSNCRWSNGLRGVYCSHPKNKYPPKVFSHHYYPQKPNWCKGHQSDNVIMPDWAFDFGKYSGCTIIEVCENLCDARYVLWCITNLRKMKCRISETTYDYVTNQYKKQNSMK